MILLLLSVLSLNINASEDLGTCNLDEDGNLNCIGEKVTNDELKKISAKLIHLPESRPVTTINIKNTSITEIEADTFVNISIHELSIINNSKLTSIDPKAFIQKKDFESFAGLIIANNSQLVGPNLFELSNNLDTQVRLVLTGNAIKEVPENALKRTNKGHSLYHIQLERNHIERIGKGAFSAMDQIRFINISHNKINTIGDGAFYIMKELGNAEDVVLDLSYNKITSESFAASSIMVNWPHGFKPLDFSNNNITTLPQDVWGPLMYEKRYNQIKLMGNDIICDCKTKWLAPDGTGRWIFPHDLFCANTKKNFISMATKDFGCY